MEFGTFVLAASTADLSEERAAREHADAVEFRMDLTDDSLAQLDAYGGELPLIATNRVEWDGGDALDLLSITHERAEAGETVATTAMVEAGRHTRAVAPVYGSRIGYAPVDPARATAPGQYDLATLRSLVDRLLSGTTGKEDSIAESARPED